MELVLVSDLPGVQPRFGLDPRRNPTVSLGRQAGNDITLPDVSVSRRHAQLELRPNGAIVTDLGSSNGTFVNDRQVVATAFVQSGDTLRLGNISLRFDAPDLADNDNAPTQALPSGDKPTVIAPPARATQMPNSVVYDAPVPQAQNYGYAGAPAPQDEYAPKPGQSYAPLNDYAPAQSYTPRRDPAPAPGPYAAERPYTAPVREPDPPPPAVPLPRRRGLPILPIFLVVLAVFLIVAALLAATLLKLGPFAAATKAATALPSATFSTPSKEGTFFQHLLVSYPAAWTGQATPSPNQYLIFAPNAPQPTLNIEQGVPSGSTDPRQAGEISLPDPNATSDSAINALVKGFGNNNKNLQVITAPQPVALKDGTQGTLAEITFDGGSGSLNGVPYHLKMLAVRVPNNGPLCLVMVGAESSKWAAVSNDYDAILYSIGFVQGTPNTTP